MTVPATGDSAAERNKWPIFEALVPWLAGARRVLEVGAGDATHARHACDSLDGVVWQTSEAPAHYRGLVAALADADEHRLPPPIVLDVRGDDWPASVFDVVYGANVAHIMDWPAVEALFAGAGTHLASAGLLCLYGPFFKQDETPAPSNVSFDRALQARDPAMGLRHVGALDILGRRHALTRVADMAMPANNRVLIWRRA